MCVDNHPNIDKLNSPMTSSRLITIVVNYRAIAIAIVDSIGSSSSSSSSSK